MTYFILVTRGRAAPMAEDNSICRSSRDEVNGDVKMPVAIRSASRTQPATSMMSTVRRCALFTAILTVGLKHRGQTGQVMVT